MTVWALLQLDVCTENCVYVFFETCEFTLVTAAFHFAT
jgi:hypothetical protein